LSFALFVIGKFDEPFQNSVINILVLIYVAIESSNIGRGMMAVHFGRLAAARFLELLDFMGSTKYKEEDALESLADDREAVRRIEVNLHIQGAFVGVISLIAFMGLLNN
jgi:hypothetical protein